MSDDPLFDAMTADPPPPPTAPPPSKGGPAPADDPFAEAMTAAPAPDPTAPLPPKPAGPPRLRGQALLPPPAPKPAAGRPGAPAAPPPDDLSLGAVASGAWHNALPSLWHNVQQTVEPLLPQNWQADVQGVKALATDPAARARVIDMYKQRYGSVPGFLSTLKHDPFAIGSDVAALATIPAGGEGLAAKAPGVLGDVLGAAAKAGKVARLADPTYAATRIAGKGLNLTGRLAKTSIGSHILGGAPGGIAGGAVGAAIPVPGAAWATARMGEAAGAKLARGAGRVITSPAASAIGRAAAAPLPALTAFSGMQPEGGGQPPSPGGGAPGHGPTAEAPSDQPAPAAAAPFTGDPIARFRQAYPEQSSGMSDEDVTNFLTSDIGQGLFPAGPPPTSTPSSGLQGAPMRAPRGPMFSHIADIASNAGANPDEVSTLQQIARVESGGNPNARSPSGRYHGLFQYADSSGDPAADTVRALGDLRKNAQKLKGLGVNPDAGALYVMHQQGAGGGPALLTAAPGTKAIDAISRFYGSRAVARQAIAHNLGINYKTPQGEAQANAAAENMTAAEFVNLWRNKLSGVPFAEGGRVGYAEGGQVIDMTEQLLKRAEQAQRAAQASTKPLLGMSDDVVASALRVAQRGL